MTRNMFMEGPFKKSFDNLEEFALNMYYSYCFANTLEELLKAEEEYQTALAANNKTLIHAKRQQLTFYEGVIVLATAAMEESRLPMQSGSLHD